MLSRPTSKMRGAPRVWLAAIGGLLLASLAVDIVLAVQPARPPGRKATLREDGFLVVKGEPFFPVGIYHDSLDVDRYGEQLLADFDQIAAAKLNCVALSMDFSWDGSDAATSTAGKLAKKAEQQGIHLIPHVYLPELERFSRDHARWPSILVSSIGDDFNTDEDGRFQGPPKFPPARLQQLHQRVKQVAPEQLTYSSGLAHPAAPLKGYVNSVDILGIQCYPFGDENQSWRNELEATNDLLENYWLQTGPTGPALWANLQAFAWKAERQPTAADMRAQAWLAILAQVRGILWYSYLSYADKQPIPQAHPDLWNELGALAPEIRALTPYLVDGQYTMIPNPADVRFDNGPGTWHAGFWQHPEAVMLVVVNADRQQPLTLDLPLPQAATGQPFRPFAAMRYPAALRVEQGRLRGALAARGVDVLLWPTAPPSQ